MKVKDVTDMLRACFDEFDAHLSDASYEPGDDVDIEEAVDDFKIIVEENTQLAIEKEMRDSSQG